MAKDIDTTSPHYKGKFADIYAVERKYPQGGVDGDYVEIQGWAHYWNPDRATWCVNAQRDSYWDELITGIADKVSDNGNSGGDNSGDSSSCNNCANKLDKSSLVQTTGDSPSKIMSQKAVTEQLKSILSLIHPDNFSITMYSSNGWNFSSSMVTKTDSEGNYLPFTTLSVKAFYYNTEVTDKIYKVKWTRETSYAHDDEVWNLKHEGLTNNIPITFDDLGGDNYQIGDVIFRCEAQYTIDGTSHQSAMIITL